MISIERISPNGITITNYNPDIHDNTNHYMSNLYRARYNKKRMYLSVCAGDGTLFPCNDVSLN